MYAPHRAAAWVANNMSIDHSATINLSSTIRKAVGGLLSAQDLASGDGMTFLCKAIQIISRLLEGFRHGSASANSKKQWPEVKPILTLNVPQKICQCINANVLVPSFKMSRNAFSLESPQVKHEDGICSQSFV